jgi:membrane-associated HD superfamily phosphohydrolase
MISAATGGLVAIIASLVLMIISVGVTSFYLGEKDNYQQFKTATTVMMALNSVAVVALMIGIVLFYTRYSDYAHLFSLILSGFAIFLGLTAVSVASLSKVF